MPNKICIEATLISARGLRRSSSSLWKRHWYAVGWIDPKTKYCTTVSKDGSSTPTWKTKFSTLLDESSILDSAAALTVEVYSREPIFLRESLEGTATILLKEFVSKYYANKDRGSSSSSGGGEEVGSFQLRKRSSNRSRGLVDVSIRVADQESGDLSGSSSYPGGDEGIVLKDYQHGNSQTQMFPLPPFQRHPQNPTPSTSAGFTHQMPYYPAYHHHHPTGPGNQALYPTMPPHHPPPLHFPAANVGYYTPTFVPNSEYVNMPASGATSAAHGRWSGRPTAGNLAAGAGVGGALAAGAMIYGDDVMSAFGSIPLQDPSLAISLDPPFL